ncbi:MAG: copper amine oxidase N-terminal domain-containing protein [Anaeromicrobium sp.]|jgi:hypothetical protein|uniref:copper amine oxidase N-terminal domain-containing protein n=1 Tax=Anaeromicrobium sp. TaxID=1929132 RepID=UPI0025D7CE5E|nr:copper amine oxidase N-terminal domain-containing protein [Anaeromicrobium sp.]MCT4592733.1 copper amine oxidase N-terminal domain-containing protein [Anaeromicrobium sp.]
MKKRIALLAMATMLALTPVAAFASSDNSVTKIVTSKVDAKLDTTAKAPVLKIENDEGDFGASETIELKLSNAEWLKEADLQAEFNSQNSSVTATVYRKSDTRAEIIVTGLAKGEMVKMPMFAELTTEGVATVAITSKSGVITEEELTFAKITDGSTAVTIEDTVTFGDDATLEVITVEETAIGSIDTSDLEYIKLELPKDFEFKSVSGIKVSGDLIADDSKVVATKEDDNEVKLTFQAGALNASLANRGEIEISGVEIEAGKDADEEKVYLTLKSDCDDIKTTKLEVGEYKEYDVTVEADDDLVEIFSGRYEGGMNTTDEAHELTQLNIKEEVLGSWTDGKTVTVEFPKEVKILNVVSGGDTITDEDTDDNEFEFEITKATKKDMNLTFYVSVEPGFTGDITAKVESRGLEKDYEVVLGKALAPVKIQTEVAKIKAGVREQEIGKITITETKEEAIKEGKIIVELDNDMEWDDEPTVKVVKGDLEIDEDNIEVEDNILTITVDKESDEVSTIEITDGKVKVDRSIAEGGIVAEIKGDALLENGYDEDSADSKSVQLDKGKFSQDYYAKVEVANVITPADDNTTAAEPAKFVIGNGEYVVGDKVKVADVAPYIKDGRTMLSLRYVAEAMGVENNNIMWDGSTRTVTIFKGDRIAQVQIGSNKMMVNGTPIIMDTIAEIKEGRTMLPVSFVAKALGAEVAWDGATKTVTIK